jgi:hypothetical protein
MKIGDRVQLNEAGRKLHRTTSPYGLIVGESKTGACWIIKWRGEITRNLFHKNYIEPLQVKNDA